MSTLHTPEQIVAELDKYVVGQARAKRTLAVALSQHYLSVAYEGSVRIKKANVLLLGPPGVGKTMMVQTIARVLNVPFDSISATAISPAGWVGDKAETVVERMYQRARSRYGKDAWNKALAGICYVDEIDKLADRGVKADAASGDRSFNTKQIQQGLLRVIEGIELRIDGNPFPTERILFIASGAFVGLDAVVQRRESGGKASRAAQPVNPLRYVLPQDLIEYGFLPEFVGRFPVTIALDRLTDSDLIAVLRDVEDSLIAQKRAMLSVRGCDLDVDESVLRNMARSAIAQGTGARGLQTMVERLLEPLLYELPDRTLLRIGPLGVVREGLPSSGRLSSAPPRGGEPRATPTQEAV